MKKLKQRWGITSNFQLFIIFVVFAITGSSAAYLGKPILAWIHLDKAHFGNHFFGNLIYYILRLLIIFPIYQVLLIVIGTLFGQFSFFWKFEKKMLRRMGLGFLWKS